MALSSVQTSTVTTDGTEQTLVTSTAVKRFQMVVDTSTMALGNILEFRAKEKIPGSGGTARQVFYAVIRDVQTNPAFVFPEIVSLYSVAYTVKLTAGSNITMDWNLLDVLPFYPAADTVAVVTTLTNYIAPDNATITSIKVDTGTTIPANQTTINNNVLTRLPTASYVTPPTAIQNADALLDRNMGTGVDSGGRTVRSALRLLRNKVVIALGVITVYKEDDTTPDYTAAVTTDASADPIVSVDP